MKSVRILQVSTMDFGGGAEGSAWSLHRAYGGLGYDSWLIVGNKRSADPNVVSLRENAGRWADMGLGREFGSGNTRWSAGALYRRSRFAALVRAARRRLARFSGLEDFAYPATRKLAEVSHGRPSIVHCHNLHGDYFDLGVLPSLSSSVPVILNLRDTWLLTGHCAYFLDCLKWQSGCGRCPNLGTYPKIRRDATAFNWRRKKHIFSKSRLYITAPSKWLLDQARASMLNGVDYKLIPNGIDTSIFTPLDRRTARALLGIPPDARVVLMINHSEFKDTNTMLDALSRLKNPDRTRDLLFISLGRNGNDGHLGEGRVKFLPRQHGQSRMALFYQAADLYLHAATGEAFGKTVTEAMACGTPVVATRVGGIPEQIEDGVNGLLVEPGDAEGMSAAAYRLLADSPFYRAVSTNGVARVGKNYDLSTQVAAFLTWYREVRNDWLEWRDRSRAVHV